LALTLPLSHALTTAEAGAFSSSAHGNGSILPYACGTCHVGHGPPKNIMLPDVQTNTCLTCHGDATAQSATWMQRLVKGSSTLANISAEFRKAAHHPQNGFGTTTTVNCSSCHQEHYLVKVNRTVDLTKVRMIGDARGKTQAEYTLCYTCHGTGAATDIQTKMRSTNPSFHPVEAVGKSSSVPSLLAPYTVTSIIACTTCHRSEATSGPFGPHGSANAKILKANYSTADGQAETATQYALCYTCHNRTAITGDTGGFRRHHLHVADERASCHTCHNSHGSSLYAHLIEFDPKVVTANSSGLLKWAQTGAGKGSCWLRCHGENHNPLSY